jgi:trk system potassium uptake protein TrkH
MILIFLTVTGACAGSTAGGFKMSRVVILFKSAVAKVKKLVRPRKVEVVYMDSKPLSESTVDSVMGYFVVYVLVFIVCTVLISIYNPNMPNIDLETTITSSLTCLNNVGPGLGSIVGPAGNFSSYSNFSKLVLTLEMIAGRLELFPILLLFSPNMWRKNN